MFTIKAIGYEGAPRHGYEAVSYTVDGSESAVTFQPPVGVPVTIHLGKVYRRIIVENVAGKTVENLVANRSVQEARSA